MRKSLLLAVFCILVLPVCFTTNLTVKAPLTGNAIAIAGHTAPGACDCDVEGCNCDNGGGNGLYAWPPDGGVDSTGADSRQTGELPSSGVEPGAGLMMFALAFFFWLRMRL